MIVIDPKKPYKDLPLLPPGADLVAGKGRIWDVVEHIYPQDIITIIPGTREESCSNPDGLDL